MNLQPTLNGARVILRPLTQGDYDALYEVASDPLIWEQHPEPTRYQPEVFKKFFDDAMASKGAFVILDAKTNQVIGSSRFYEYDDAKKEVVIGYTFLSRAYWGGTYNREVKKLMLFHAYRFVKKVFFHVGENNFRSQQAMKKIGGFMVEKRVIPAPNGETRTLLVYQVNLVAGEAL